MINRIFKRDDLFKYVIRCLLAVRVNTPWIREIRNDQCEIPGRIFRTIYLQSRMLERINGARADQESCAHLHFLVLDSRKRTSEGSK